MVDALREATRVLVAGGTLIDIRPVGEISPLEVARGGAPLVEGGLDTTGLIADDHAADAAAAFALDSGWLACLARHRFTIEFQWSDLAEFEAYVAGGRQPKCVRPACGELRRIAGQHASVRAQRTIVLGVYRKSGGTDA